MPTEVITPDKVKTCPACGATTNHYRSNRSWYCTTCYDARYCKTPCPRCSRPMKIGSIKCAECRWGGADPKDMTSEQVAWLAGILEGEGSFIVKGHRAVTFQVVMTDRDIIDRLVQVTGVGRINGFAPAKSHYKQAWVWLVRRRAHVIFVITAVMPWLGERRTAAAQRVLDELAKPLSAPPEGVEPSNRRLNGAPLCLIELQGNESAVLHRLVGPGALLAFVAGTGLEPAHLQLMRPAPYQLGYPAVAPQGFEPCPPGLKGRDPNP
jgi:hypothetical protein